MTAGPRGATGGRNGAPVPPVRTRRDRLAMVGVTMGFGFALGQGMLVLPLLALAAGYDAAAVGLLASVSAISQVGMRLTLPRLLARYPDRLMMAIACGALAASYSALFISSALPVFIVAQLLQGSARAWFWTSSQTHAIRSGSGSGRSIAEVTIWGNIGTFLGPAVAGLLATASLILPVAVGVAFSLLALVASLGLARLPTYDRLAPRGATGRMWRRPGVDLACWSNVSTGGWRALLNSYVPVILDAVGHPPAVIGAIQSMADLFVTASAVALSRWQIVHTRRAIGIAVGVTALATMAFPFVAQWAILAGLAIGVSGIAAGIQMTLSPSLAGEAVTPNEQGEAIAVAGTFRAGALLVTPAALSATLAVIALPVAVAVTGAIVALPTAIVLVRNRRPASLARDG